MVNHAYVVVASLPGATELHVAVATDEADACEIISRRADARPGEYITVASVIHDDVAQKIGADLFRHGKQYPFMPA